jgi:phosphoribosyl 1,2-cyclic phosphate phosphodiesterase
MSPIELLFLGTGTSAGVPMIACRCDVCRSTDPRDKRNRASVVVSYGATRVLVDTTPELRLQCVTHGVESIDAVVYTHAHADHVMGLDDVRRFNTVRTGPIDVWADERTFSALGRCFAYAFKEPEAEQKLFRPHLVHRLIDPDEPFHVGPLKWTPVPLLHGDLPVLGFRIGRLAYCTDVSKIPEPSFALLEGLDVLVLDALQYKKHTTHFSVEEAIEAAKRIGARQTLFTHIAHALPHEETNRLLPEGMDLAYDGQRVTARAG